MKKYRKPPHIVQILWETARATVCGQPHRPPARPHWNWSSSPPEWGLISRQVFMILGDYGAHEISRWEQVCFGLCVRASASCVRADECVK
jgi:hypothetical protein